MTRKPPGRLWPGALAGGNVASSEWSSPAAITCGNRVRVHPGGHAHGGGVEVEAHTARTRQASSVQREAIAQVEHRGGSRERGGDAVRDRGAGVSWAASGTGMLGAQPHGGLRLRCTRVIDRALEQQREALRGGTQGAGDRDHVAHARAVASHRLTPLEVAERRHRDREGGRHAQISADNTAARCELGAGNAQPLGEPLESPTASRRVLQVRRRAPSGRAPIAATSLSFVAAALNPRSCGVDHAKRKSVRGSSCPS